MSASTSRALGGNRTEYAGLGDCFILTNPAKSDNPILYASDGFIDLTGYTRVEVIHSNCRFLRSQQIDVDAVARVRNAIAQREECVELLLNEKKGGHPFWNLLYIAPLFDGNGELIFFLGGQIDCSTVADKFSNVLRILIQPVDSLDRIGMDCSATDRARYGSKLKRCRTMRESLRNSSKPSIQSGPPGAGSALLEHLEDASLDKRLGSLYLTYSKFVVFDHSSYNVALTSQGIVDSLYPARTKKTTTSIRAIGQDVFKFLGNYSSGPVPAFLKSAVKGSLRDGRAISLERGLCAEPRMEFEVFELHWTALKDEVGAVAWVVLTLGEMRA